MTIWRWILTILYTFLFTYALVAVLEPGSALQIGVLAGGVLTLVLSYTPGVAKDYEGLTKEMKQVINIILMIIVSGVIFGLSCFNMLAVGIFCTWAGALDLLLLLVAGLIGNQSVYGANKYLADKVRKRLYG